MSLTCLTIQARREQVAFLSDALEACNALAVSIAANSDEKVFGLAPEDAPLWEKTKITALFEAETKTDDVIAQLENWMHTPLQVEISTLEDQDWVRITQAHFPPRCFSDHLWVYPSWFDAKKNTPSITIDPGLAFGTGTHPTTALCLTALCSSAIRHQYVVDYGCGSGILALAAARLGAKRVWATDHDEQAMEASLHNAELNPDITQQLVIQKAKPQDWPKAQCVVANILAAPLIQLKPTLISLLKEGGDLIVSGLLSEEADKMIKAYAPLHCINEQHLDGWCLLHFQQPRRAPEK